MITLTDHTIRSENGTWSNDAAHLLFEGAAMDAAAKDRRIEEVSEMSGYSRTMVLDALQDSVEIIPARARRTT